MSGTPNTSNQPGYLTPTSGPTEDTAFTTALIQFIAGITGLPSGMVRARWQPTPPNQPGPDVDWCAIGVTLRTPVGFPYFYEDTTGNNGAGQQVMSDQEDFTVVASFYGPDAYAYAGVVRRGVMVAQNRDALLTIGVKVLDVGEATNVPDLINLQFIEHVDLRIAMSRMNTATFNIYTFLGIPLTVTTDSGFSETETTTASSTPLEC